MVIYHKPIASFILYCGSYKAFYKTIPNNHLKKSQEFEKELGA